MFVKVGVVYWRPTYLSTQDVRPTAATAAEKCWGRLLQCTVSRRLLTDSNWIYLSSPPSFSNITMHKMTTADDPQTFLEMFEATVKACGWPAAEWAVPLLPLLSGCPLMEVGQVIRVAGPPTPSPGPGGTYSVPVRIQRGIHQAMDLGCMQFIIHQNLVGSGALVEAS